MGSGASDGAQTIRWPFLLGLLGAYFTLIVLGGVCFHYIETPNEETNRHISAIQLDRFLDNNTCVTRSDIYQLINQVIEAYKQGIIVSNETVETDSNWDFVSSIFFCSTIATTIGYGNITPTTPGGRALAVVLALLIIPLFLVCTSQLAAKLSIFTDILGTRICGHWKNTKAKPFVTTFIVTVAGLLLFIFLPALLFHLMESWSYGEALYYAFISLTTIGFGDFVPGFANGVVKNTIGQRFYRLFVCIWMIFGIVWMATIIASIQSGISANAAKITDVKMRRLAERENHTHQLKPSENTKEAATVAP